MENEIQKFETEGESPAIVSSSLFEMLEQYSDTELEALFERRSRIMKFVRDLAMKKTTSADWVNLGDKPYLVSAGAEKVAAEVGVSWHGTKSVKTEKKDAKGEYYAYEYTAQFSIMNRTIDAVGTCNSRDQFFMYFNEWTKDPETGESKKERKIKLIEDIDEDNIKKAAYTNCLVNGITRILGLRNLTWEELAKYGIKKESSQRVEYGKKGTASQGGTYPATEKQIGAIKGMLKRSHPEIADKDRDEMLAKVKTGNKASKLIEALGKNGLDLETVGKLFADGE